MTYKALKDSGSYKGIESTQYLTSKTFYSSDNIQEWIVPAGVTQVHIDCVASKGKDGDSGNVVGGNGGRVQCNLSVIPNQKYYIIVGKMPTNNSTPTYNASDIRTDNTGITDSTSLASRLIVAGGGGCAGIKFNGPYNIYNGGDGGGISGESADSSTYVIGGTGGTQSAGGIQGDSTGSSTLIYSGSDGYLGLGGYSNDNTVAIGGAGWYGGGSGCVSRRGLGGSYHSSGGGGGSSYTDSSLCSDVTHTQGYNDGEGYITISAINAGDYIATRKGYRLIKE